MQEKKKYITLYYVSALSLILALLCFFRYLVHRWYVELIFFIAFLLTYFILFRVCSKALQCEDGYSLMQAIYFYQICEQAGYRGSSQKKDIAVLTSTAERCDFLENAEPEYLKRCFETGREADKAVTDPAVRLLWSLRGKITNRGGKKHV